jgi:hypothetical protein
MNSLESKQQTTRLFVALEYGEQLASLCARQQSKLLAENRLQRRHFLTQARQENFHAHFFRRAIQFLNVEKEYSVPTALQNFAMRLQKAIQKNDIVETLVGQQIVLESFGAAILERLNSGMDKQAIGFRHLRYTILAQEQSHQDFGESILQQKLQTGCIKSGSLCSLAGDYLMLVDDILGEMDEVFYCLDENPHSYLTSLYLKLPYWLKESAA